MDMAPSPQKEHNNSERVFCLGGIEDSAEGIYHPGCFRPSISQRYSVPRFLPTDQPMCRFSKPGVMGWSCHQHKSLRKTAR